MIYDTVMRVLAALDQQGQADHDDWADQVASSLSMLEEAYRHLLKSNRDLIDYSELSTQSAYVFRYVLGHADFTYSFLKHARETTGKPLFTATDIRITSIGGGPGSELLGLIKYLSEENGEPAISKITYTVIDKESNWLDIVEMFVEEIQSPIEIDVALQEFDVESTPLRNNVSLSDEDLVIMCFFVSEVCELPGKANVIRNVDQLLSSMKPGGLLLYNDSNAYSFYTFLNHRVRAAGRFTQLIDINIEYRTDTPNYDGIMEEYVDEFDYRPKLNSNAVTKLLIRTK